MQTCKVLASFVPPEKYGEGGERKSGGGEERDNKMKNKSSVEEGRRRKEVRVE